MNVYLVQNEICFDYRKFPWIKKSRGSVFQKCDTQVVVSDNEYNAEKKFSEEHKEISLYGLWKYVVDGALKVMCKEPNWEVKTHITKLDNNINIGNYMKYMTLEDLKLLTNKSIPEE